MAGRSPRYECGLSAGKWARFQWPFTTRCFPAIAERARQQTDYSRGMTHQSGHGPFFMKNSDRNLSFGWWSLLVYLSLGLTLETLHGFKIGWYLDVGNEIRRLMFTLGHAHGTALALVSIAAGLTARNVKGFELRPSVSFA